MLNYHWIPEHRDWSDREYFVEQRPRFIKVVSIDQNPLSVEDVAAAGAGYICRIHPMSENWFNRNLESLARAAEIGRRHAEHCRPVYPLIVARGIRPDAIWFEGLNEPQVWTQAERPELVAAYYLAFLQGIHAFGARAVVGNFGVGWPNNDGPDTPVNWKFFEPVLEAMITSGTPYWDYLGLHEYWAYEGPEQKWRWWAGRCLQAPARVPILITECGIDSHVAGAPQNLGWQTLPENSMDERAVRFVDELWRYMKLLRADSRVQGIFSFTYDQSRQNDWWTFNVRDNTFKAALRAKRAQEACPIPGAFNPGAPPPAPPPPPPPPPEEPPEPPPPQEEPMSFYDVSGNEQDAAWAATYFGTIDVAKAKPPCYQLTELREDTGDDRTLSVTLRDHDGNPLSGVSVVLAPRDIGGTRLFTTTDAAGVAQFNIASIIYRYVVPGQGHWVIAVVGESSDVYNNVGWVMGASPKHWLNPVFVYTEQGSEPPPVEPPPGDWLGEAIGLIEQGLGILKAHQ